MKKLYYIINSGCDASTRGIAELSEQEISILMKAISDLNENSYYGCMPVIAIREITWDDLKEVTIRPDADVWDDDYVDRDYCFQYNGKTYTWKDQHTGWRVELLPAIM